VRDGLIYWLFLMTLRRSPMLLLAVVGSLFAIIRWKRHPRASLLTVLALVLYLIDAFIVSTIFFYIPAMTRRFELSSSAIDWLFFCVYFIADFVPALTIILLVAAAFIGRRQTSDSIPATS